MSWFADQGFEAALPESGLQNQVDPTTAGQGGIAPQAQQGGFDRTAFRDAWQSSPGQQSIQDFVAKNPQFSQGVQPYRNPQTGRVSSDVYSLPTGETIDLSINSQNGVGGKGWTDTGHDSQGRAYAPAGGGGGGGGGVEASARSFWGEGGLQASGGTSQTGQLGTQVALPAAPTYQNFQSTAPAIGTFAPTSTYGQQGPFQGAGNVPTPDRLNAQNLATPDQATYNNFNQPPGFVAPTAEEASRDPGYQFRQDSAAQALENSASAKGMLRTNNTWQGLQDQAGQLASQEYGNVYNRRLGESQKNYQEGFQTNQANNAGNLAVNQANAQTGLQYGQTNNQNTLAFGQANNQASAAQQAAQYAQGANTYGMNQQGQAQQYGQQANTYNQNLAAQNQQYQQGFNTNQANNAGQLGNYQAQVQAALGQGNLALGYTSAANQYALGQGQLALGQQQAANSYSLGQGQNALGWGQLGQNQNQFDTNQGNWLNQNAWNQNMDLAQLGNPGAPNSQGYGQGQGNIYSQQGNVNAAGQVGSANAWNQGIGAAANAGGSAYAQWLASRQPPPLE